MEKKTVSEFLKNLFIFVVVIIVFLAFLFYIIPKDEEITENHVKIYGQDSNEVLQVKYSMICDEVKSEFENTKIYEINNKYLSELIVDNKISNRENSISQELINLNKKKYYDEIMILSESLIEPILENYDIEQERRWRNYEFYFDNYNFKNSSKSDTSFIFYNKRSILKNFAESEVKANCSFVISPYVKEVYYITLINDTVETVEIDLITFDGEEKLSKYINLNTRKPIIEIKKIDSGFVRSDEKYEFTFKIWS